MTATAVCANETHFSRSRYTGKERDTESGNDYFEARYYSSSMGRFMSPDWSAKEEGRDPVPYSDLDDPQSLNLYSYVRNNPLTRVDADGHIDWDSVTIATTTIAGGLIGGLAGGASGASAGTLVAPGVGTIGGGYEGAMLGGTGGALLGAGLGKTIVNLENKLLSKDSSASAPTATPAATGPKAATAPGVTAGGQATDEHGRKLGPSNKPQVNNVPKNTREAAKNAGNKGGGTVEHSNPKDGSDPHFHTTRGDGTKVQDSTHYTYPK
jgi:RHS repeat-associated protein